MIKLVKQLLLSKKKWNIILCLFMSISITAIVSLSMSSEGIKNHLLERSYDEYGEYSAVLYEKPNDDINYTTYGLLDVMVDDNTGLKATIGWMDSDMYEIGRLNLKEGNIPKEKNDIVVEEFYLSNVDPSWEIGQTKTFQIHGEEYPLTLTGVLENYSYRWSGPADLSKGVNDFPNIILSNNLGIEASKEFYPIILDGSVRKVKKQTIDLITDNSFGFSNSNLLDYGLMDYGTISFITTVFQIIILCLTAFCLILSFTYYKASFNQQIGVYKALGFPGKSIVKLEITQIGILFAISMLVSIPLIYITTGIIVRNTYGLASYDISWNLILGLVIWLTVLFSVFLTIMIQRIKVMLNYSALSLLKGSFLHENQSRTLYHSNFYINYLIRQVAIFPKQILLNTLVIALCIISLFYALFLEKESAGIWDVTHDYYISHAGYSHEYKNDQLVLLTELIPFNYEKVNQLEKNNHIESIYKEPFMLDVALLFPEQGMSTDLHELIKSSHEEDSGKITADRNYSTGNYIPWNELNYVWVTAEEYNHIAQKFNFELRQSNHQEGLMIFLPQNSTVNEKDFHYVDSIMLSKIIKDNNGKYEQKEWEYKLDAIINKTDELFFDKVSQTTIVMVGNHTINSGISGGYKSLSIKLDDSSTTEDIKIMNKEVLDIVAPVPNVLYQDLNAFRIEDTNIARYVGFMGMLNFLIVSILVFFSIFLMIYGKFLVNKERWAIFLANGMSKKKMNLLLSSEVFIYYLAGSIISIIFFIFIIGISDTQLPISYYLSDLFTGIVSIFILIIVMSLLMFLKIESKSILSLIRLEE